MLLKKLRAVVVEGSGLKPCGRSSSGYSIKSTSRSFSVRFAMGERSAIGLKLIESLMGFPGLCRGTTRPTFQMFGIFALFTERFMLSVRYLSTMEPR